MDKTVAGVLGAVTALAAEAHAAPPPTLDAAMQASSYADLLRPIPNALELLATEPEAGSEATAHPVQYYQPYYQPYYPPYYQPYYQPYYYHHHHHHRFFGRGNFHHHHHHFHR